MRMLAPPAPAYGSGLLKLPLPRLLCIEGRPLGFPRGLLHDFHQSLRSAVENAFRQIDLSRLESGGPPDWAWEFISEHGFLNEV
mgnify:CR=1 FL=1